LFGVTGVISEAVTGVTSVTLGVTSVTFEAVTVYDLDFFL